MTIDELVPEIRSRSLQLRRSGDELVLRGSKAALDSNFVSELHRHKAALFGLIDSENGGWWSPPIVITPAMLPLVELTNEEIERIVALVPDRARNVQDIYPLAPLQEGILFHYLMGGEGDPYLLGSLFSFVSRALLDRFLQALQAVIDRHDILRTGVVWEGLPEPVQVVWRKAVLPVEEVDLGEGTGDGGERLYARYNPRSYRMDVREAPLLRAMIARDKEQERWLLLLLRHHLVGDHSTLDVMQMEIEAYLLGEGEELGEPQPFRNLVAQARLGARREEQEEYFRKLLGDVEEPTAPFGMLDVRGDGRGIEEGKLKVEEELGRRMREGARKLGVSAASLCHVAWGRVVSQLSGREDVVFGSVLFGRMQGGEGAERGMGLFINTLPVRVGVGEGTAEESVRGVHRQLTELLRHEHASLALAQQCSGVAKPQPLFTSVLNYRHSGGMEQGSEERKKRAWEGIRVLHGEERSNYPCTFSVDDLEIGFSLRAQVQASIAPMRVCRYMHTALESLVEALESASLKPVRSLNVLPAEERRQLLYEWNETKTEYASQRCVHELFEEQVERNEEAIALVYAGEEVSYGELNRRANRLAHYLRELGVKPDALAAICVHRGFDMIVGVLGVLKAGGAYVPLDPAYPEERLNYMLEDCAPTVLLTHAHLQSKFAGLNPEMPVVDLAADFLVWEFLPETNLDASRLGLTSDHLAYLIYTSGSTGKPKGVMIPHRGLSNLVRVHSESLAVSADSRILQFASFSFDASVWEIVMALCQGAALFLIPQDQLLVGNTLMATVAHCTITHLTVPPSVLADLPEAARLESLGVLVVAGEVLTNSVMKRWGKDRLLINAYGPTEATICATMHRADVEEADNPPIGKAISNTRIYILDGQGEPVPVGVAGEIYIAGVSLARGYLHRGDLTAERFVPDSFSGEVGARMYATGDEGRWRADGIIEFVGRNDFQVKVRGFRIELGEIESQLREHHGVREAMVIAREDTPGNKRLVAYYTHNGEQGSIEAEELRTHLSTRLPEHMVPAAYFHLDSLPLTRNGKLDRRALPAPESNAFGVDGYEPPQGETEIWLAKIWAEILELEHVGRHDDFFVLGGHSMLVVRLLTQLQQDLGVEVEIDAVFEHPKLADLAQVIERAAHSKLPPVTRADRSQRLPLSFAQRRLWFLAQMERVSEAYHIPLGLHLKGRLDRAALQRALTQIVARHETLRTTFVFLEEEAVQRIGPSETSDFHLVEHDLREHLAEEQELERVMAEEACTPFDLEAGPLIRGRLIQAGEEEHVLLITMHHIVSDGWSMEILIKELSILYTAFLRGESDPLAPLEIQYADYAVWQRKWIEGEILRQQGEYWKRALMGAPVLLELPMAQPRPARQDHAGAFKEVVFEEKLSTELKGLSRREGTTLYMTLLAGWAALLARLSGQHDVLIGSPVANRGRAEIQNLIGFFINTMVSRVNLSSAPTVNELLAQVKEQSLAAQQHQDIPFEQVVELMQPTRSLAHSALVQVMFSWQNASREKLTLPGLELRPLKSNPHRIAKVDLTLSLHEAGDRIVGGLEYAASLFEKETIHRYLGYFRRLLEGMVGDGDQIVECLPILAMPEQHQLLYEWNKTEKEHPGDHCVNELFEEQAHLWPNAVAVVCEGKKLTYDELNRRANRLGHHLRKQGVRPDERVGICMKRSVDMVVGLLGVIKAGGAYVALDSGYPEERLRYMIQDAEIEIVLTQKNLAEKLRNSRTRLICMDEESNIANIQQESCQNLEPAAEIENLVYVMYTSGSTGRPKGVGIEHRQLVNYVRGIRTDMQELGLGVGAKYAMVSTLSADLGNTAIYPALVSGGELHVIGENHVMEGRYLGEYFEREKIDLLKIVPSHLEGLREAKGGEKVMPTKALVAGGEALTWKSVRRWKTSGGCVVINHYGPTETTVGAARFRITNTDVEEGIVPIGQPLKNVQLYVVDRRMELVPIGVAGELCISGAGVGRGYVNRPELTAQSFVPNVFTGFGERLYRTGDRARWRKDGNIEFLGRIDEQVKIRGFRIELGEIEVALRQQPGVEQAAVLAVETENHDPRLVAYISASPDGALASAIDMDGLRARLRLLLPDYMIPAAFVLLKEFPLNANGKLDRKALPAPDAGVHLTRGYEAPIGEVETTVARIWAEVLEFEQVGRNDNFFELGGHSLLAVTVAERMSRAGLSVEVATFFDSPKLKDLVKAVNGEGREVVVPPNLIPLGCMAIIPAMLSPMVSLSQSDIDSIVAGVRGGTANVQDIYPLAPLQEGILFHHLIGDEGDPYLEPSLYSFVSRALLDRFLQALQAVIDRHDILRTGVVWEGLPEPVQVVWRKAVLPVEEVDLGEGTGDGGERLYARYNPRSYRMDVREAPLLRAMIARDKEQERWLLLLLRHHLVGDHSTLDVMQMEIEAYLLGEGEELWEPQPFRNLVAQARLGARREEQEEYFRKLLGDVEEPTAPFGMLDVRGDGRGIEEGKLKVEEELGRRMREGARKLGVSAASLCHVAWGRVVSQLSGREDVVFGSVLFGRMQGGEGAERGMGLFINTLPVRIRIANESAEESVRGVHRQLTELLRHEHASLALAQQCSGVAKPQPLFTSVLNYRHSGGMEQGSEERKKRAWEGIRVLHGEERTNYPVALAVDDLGEHFRLKAQVEASVDANRVCNYMHTALESLVEALESASLKPVRSLNVLPAEERRQLLYEWNETKTEYASQRCVHELFEEQVERNREAIALVYAGEEVSYGELNGRANRLAHYLREMGVRPEERVGICVERGVEMMVAVLGVLKAGGGYVPLDPGYPEERLRYMVEDSGPVVVLTERKRKEWFIGVGAGVKVVELDGERREWEEQPSSNPEVESVGVRPEDVAYVIYTSGSTGKPKGVMVEHGGVVNVIEASIGRFKLGSGSRVVQLASLSFDASVLEMWMGWGSGGRVYVAEREVVMSGGELGGYLEEKGISVMAIPPSLLETIPGGEYGRLETIVVGGEACSEELADRWSRGRALWNAYAPTEATIYATVMRYEGGEGGEGEKGEKGEKGGKPGIGRGIANTQVYILDGEGEPVPVGVVGEIYIGGAGVARGYLNRAELTGERFVPNPYIEDRYIEDEEEEGGEGSRLYRSGDLGRWRKDGNIEFVGRNDEQVKIRGYRIELGEIEAQLREYAVVEDAVVVVREDVGGDKRLVAYYTVRGEEETAGADELRAHVSGSLPEYMVPAAYVQMERMPLTVNGKLDRKALPGSEGEAYAVGEYEAPEGEIESQLASIWAEMLKIDRVGRHDNFFALGGHSLLAVRVAARIQQELRVEVAIRDVFDHPELAGLAQVIESAAQVELPPIMRAERGERLPLSFAQQRLWFLAQIEGVSRAYHVTTGVELRGTLDRTAFCRALDRIIARHEALRTTFMLVEGEPAQRIAAITECGFQLLEHDLRQSVDPAAELQVLIEQEAGTKFDLERGPLIRGRLIRQEENQYALLITIHHIIFDGWSIGILLNELSALYGAFAGGEDDPLPELRLQYADYTVWQRQWITGSILQQQAGYWTKTLTGAPALLELPADHPRPAQQDYAGGIVELTLDEKLTTALQALGQKHGTTMFMTLLAGWVALLARLSGQHDLVIGTPVANRGRSEIESLIGFFVNTLALRVTLSDHTTAGKLLETVKAQALAAQQYQDIPFEHVVELAGPERSLAHSPLFQVMFVWQNMPQSELKLPGVKAMALQAVPHVVTKFDLTLMLRQAGPIIRGGVEYASALFEPATIERYLQYLRRLLEGMSANEALPVQQLSLLSDRERQQVLYDWNATAAEYPGEECVHGLFEAQVRRSPSAVALVYEGTRLTYIELNRRANQLAHYLRSLGVKPDTRVAISAQSGVEMMVGLLGILKAGGAYVPLDPTYPIQRLRYMLEDSAPAVLLTEGDMEEHFSEVRRGLPIINLGSNIQPWKDQPETDPECKQAGLTSHHVAYLIYTSGSTGQPKGVMVEHRNVINLACSQQELFGVGEQDRILQFFSFSFDVSMFVLVMALNAGARLVLARQEELLPGTGLVRLLQEEGITLAVMPPVVLSHLPDAELPKLRQVVLGGEPWSEELVERWGKGRRFFNSYGPTETTVQATVMEYRRGDGKPSIGRPIRNVHTYLLDTAGHPVPVGVAGELYIGGDGVGRGYVVSDLTAERFVPDPFSGKPGSRMYRTGDWGRWLPDGRIDLLGRKDEQVKIRGYRVELGEINAILGAHPLVQQSVVILTGEKESGDQRLIAYFIATNGQNPKSEDLRAYLKERLPDYMVPAQFVMLEEFPLTESGKVNRRALPAPQDDECAGAGHEYEAPEGKTESKLAAIWGEILKLEEVGRNNNFFELGGHSLLAVRMVSRIRQELNVEVTIRDLFTHPRLIDLARVIGKAGKSELPRITRADRSQGLPLSYAQQRLWFLAQMGGVSEAYHVPLRVRMKGELDRAGLRWALNRIVERHEALRTTFAWEKEAAVQRIAAAEESQFPMREEDLREHGEQEREVERRLTAEARRPFDLEAGPLLRGLLLRVGEEEHVLQITMHHIVSDGWSMGLLMKEMSALYGGYLRGEEDGLAELEIQYGDYAVWQRRWMEGEVLRQQGEYWKRELRGAPVLLDLPTDRRRPMEQDYRGDFAEMVLEEELSERLRGLSQRHGTTLYMTLLAGWAVLLGRLSGQGEVVIGSPVANRGRAEIENLIGFFVNTLAMRVDVTGKVRVKELLGRVKEKAVGAQQNQDMPFEQVVEMVQPERSLGHSPLFQVMFTWQSTSEARLELSGLELCPLRWNAESAARFDLTLSLQETGERIEGGVGYATALFDRETVERYTRYLRRILEGMVVDEGQQVACLEILPAEERRQLLYEWNETKTEFALEKCIHELFGEQARRRPEAVAVVYGEQRVSYGELNEKAERLGRYLVEAGVGEESRVGIYLRRSVEMMIGILGVLKAGGAYVPLEVGLPEERLKYMVEDAGVELVLVESGTMGSLPMGGVDVVVMDGAGEEEEWLEEYGSGKNSDARKEEEREEEESRGKGNASRLAYILYTSGSTGQPKGVMVEHGGLANYVGQAVKSYLPEKIVGGVVCTPLSFDATITTLLAPLAAGKRVELLPEDETTINRLAERLFGRGEEEDDQGWLFKITPAHLEVVEHVERKDKEGRGRHVVVIGGEQLGAERLRRWKGQLLPEAVFVNEYGPTEAVVGCSIWELRGEEELKELEGKAVVPIGKAIGNVQLYVLGERGEVQPVNSIGELYIGGAGVARGYVKQEELTQERFIRNPFADERKEEWKREGREEKASNRLYRTGDFVRRLRNGNLEYVGRRDLQVKVRGYRIELGEIEGVLKQQEGVEQAVVVAREDASGQKTLVAYVVGEKRGVDVDAGRLRLGLEEKLPEYMVPAAYVQMERMPLTVNGKLDRGALPEPKGDVYAVGEYEAPYGETESRLAAIWVDVLKVERVGRHDNFFTLGGHSLLALRVVSRVQQGLGTELGIRDVFTYPKLVDLAQVIARAGKKELPRITRANRSQGLPLSFAQQRLWFLAQMASVSEAYHIPVGLRMKGELDRDGLRWALNRIVERHEALRTTFAWEKEMAVQQIAGVEESEFHLVEEDVRRVGEMELEKWMREEVEAAFDLETGPLIRGRLIRVGEEEHVLLITMHHIVSDGWSMGLLVKELSALYSAFVQGEADPLPELEIQYGDYAVWQREWIEGEALRSQGEYWKRTLAGVEGLLEIPTDRVRPAEQDHEGGVVDLVLNQELTTELKRLSNRHETTLYMTLLAGWAALLWRLSGQEEVVIGTPVANRGRTEIENLIGFFVNTLALRVELDGAVTVKELLGQVKEQALRGQQNQDIPFEQVVEMVQPVRSLAHSPLFQAIFAWQNTPKERLELPGLELSWLRWDVYRKVKFDLTLSLRESSEGIAGGVGYRVSLFDATTVERYGGYFRRLLEGMVAEDSQRVACIGILGAKEREQLLYERNETKREFGRRGRLAHELFEEQVEKNAEAIALVYEEQELSYGELNRRANQLAHYLREMEVGPEERVAICVERGLEMVVGVLGVMKAGGAYVPLDPEYPVERLKYMLEDCGAVALLTQGHLQEELGELSGTLAGRLPVLDLAGETPAWKDRPTSNPDPESIGLTPEHLAYVIYTSGSTGRPKGAMVEHRNLCSYLLWSDEAYYRQEGCGSPAIHAVGFDGLVTILFGPLLSGQTLTLARHGMEMELIAQGSTTPLPYTLVKVTPAHLKLLNQRIGSEECRVLTRALMIGGEALVASDVMQWQRRFPGVRVVNHYGSTETAVGNCTFEITEVREGQSIPVGRPIANARMYILDGEGEPVSVGVVGEIHIGGAGVGRGYLNRPALTAERFVPDPFAGELGAKVYRTGDMGRWRGDGNIEFVGRNDFQVKIRGYRIELEEIEARLREYAGVEDAVVVAREDGGGDKRLVAYYTVRGEEETAGADELRAHMSGSLPEYMVPAAYVQMERMPLTVNGKLDRKALPAPESDAYAVGEYEAPEGEIESQLASIWAEMLKIDRVGRHDNFFALGGHSLLVVRVIERMRRSGFEVDVRTLFVAPTLAELAAAVRLQGDIIAVPPNRIPGTHKKSESSNVSELLI